MPILKHLKQHKVVLDTHVWLWLMLGDPRLSDKFKKSIKHIQQGENIFISAISIWEIGMLAEKGRIKIEMDPLDWVEQSLFFPGIVLAPLSPRIAIQSSRLPENSHGDPADRILIATAREHNAVLVTCDKILLNYGKGQFIQAYDPK